MLDEPRIGDAVWKRVLLPLGLLGLVASFLVRDSAFRETARYSLQGLALIPIFVCAMRFPGWGPIRLLNYRPVAFVGVLSYSLYLIHQVVLAALLPVVQPRFGTVVHAVLGLAVSLALAWLVHLFVERPFARLRKRFSA
jgi:peptidoglycan/LPS O-acetylase OafA/YrhL